MSCLYASDNLYCVTPEDIKQMEPSGGLMHDAVSFVRIFQENRSGRDSEISSGRYSSRFAANPLDYSLWNCNKTGASDPAFSCTLIKNSDPKRLEQELELAKFEDSVLRKLTENILLKDCGNPRTTKTKGISTTFVYPTADRGVLAEVRFDHVSRDPEPELAGIETVFEKTGQPMGISWSPSTAGGDVVMFIRKNLPCLK